MTSTIIVSAAKFIPVTMPTSMPNNQTAKQISFLHVTEVRLLQYVNSLLNKRRIASNNYLPKEENSLTKSTLPTQI